MNMHWKKAEGEIPEGEVLAVNKDGESLVGFLHYGDMYSHWVCGRPCVGSDYNETLRNVTWYLIMDEMLATVPTEET